MIGTNNYGQPLDDWRSAEFRQHVINQIMEAMKNSSNPTSKTAREMETHIFSNTDSKERYLNYVARLILHMKDNRKSDRLGTGRTNQGINNTPMLAQAFAQNQCNPSNNQTAPSVSRPNISVASANVNNSSGLLAATLLSSSNNVLQQPTSIPSQVQGLSYGQVSITSANAYGQQGQGTNQSQYPHQVQPNPSPCSQPVAFPNPSPYSQQPIMKSPHGSQPSHSPYALQQPIKSPHSNQPGQFSYVQQPIKSPHPQPQVGSSSYVQQTIRSPHPSPQVNTGKNHHSQAHQVITSPITAGHPPNSYQQQQPNIKSPAHPQSVINNRSPYPAQNIKSPVQQSQILNSRSPYPPQHSIKSPYPQSQSQPQQSSKSPFYPQLVPNKSPLLAPSPATNVTTPNSVTVSQSPATSANPGSVGSVGGSVPASSPLQSVNPHEDAAYMEKLKNLSRYITPLRKLIDRTTRKDGQKKDLLKMKSLLDILTNSQKRVSLATLIKCESVLEKLQPSFSPQSQPQPISGGITITSIAATNANGTISATCTTASTSLSSAIVNTSCAAPVPSTTASGATPSQDVCKPLIDVISANLSSPALAYALQQTCGPAFTTMKGPMASLTEPLVKRKKIKWSGVKVQPEQENVLENEMSELDSLFIIERNEHPLIDSGSFLLKCSIDAADLPPVPSIYVVVPEDYPYSSAQCQTTSLEYRANPFFVTIIEDLSSRLLKMPRVTLTGLLNAWKLSILKAYAKDQHESENCYQLNSFLSGNDSLRPCLI